MSGYGNNPSLTKVIQQRTRGRDASGCDRADLSGTEVIRRRTRGRRTMPLVRQADRKSCGGARGCGADLGCE